MTKEDFADLLAYRPSKKISKTIEKYGSLLANSGLVVITVVEEQVMQFRGAIHCDLDAPENEAFLYKKLDGSWIVAAEEFSEIEYAHSPFPEIVVQYVPLEVEKRAWFVKTQSSCAVFDSMENDDLVCRGIVLSLAEVLEAYEQKRVMAIN